MSASHPGYRRPLTVLLSLSVLLLLFMAGRLYIGSASLGWPAGWPWQDQADLVWLFRFRRMVIAVIVGAGLAISGVALQTLLRNPLAEPFILGLSTGAGAGVMLQMWLFNQLGLVFGAPHLGAVAGSLASMAIVFAAGRKRGVIDPLGLLLTGVVLSTLNGALIMLFNYLAGPGGLRDDVARWMMGFLSEGVGDWTLYLSAAVTLGGFLVLMLQTSAMDVATFSDAEASSLGVNLKRLRVLLFVTAGLLAAAAVVLAGPIAFVGLVAPHLARLMLGPSHRLLLIAAAMLGAMLILAADTLSSGIDLAWQRGQMPIGIFTAMVGGPVFLWMLRPQLGRGVD